jgi:hypothetical protein
VLQENSSGETEGVSGDHSRKDMTHSNGVTSG